MEIKDIKKVNNKIEFVVSMDKTDWKKCQNKTLTKLGKNFKIEGFRPGKVPANILKKHINMGRVINDSINVAIDDLLESLFDNDKFLNESDNFLDDAPETSIENVDEDNFVAKFTFVLWPKVEVTYKNIKLETKLTKPTFDEIDKRIKQMMSKDEMMAPKDGKIENGDIAVINFKGYVDNKPFEGGEAKNYELKIGSKSFIDNFEDQLIGLKAGDKKDVMVTFPKDYHVKDLANKKAKFEVEINVVNAIETPKLDDEYVKSLKIEKVESVDALKKHLENEIYETSKKNIRSQKEQELLTKIIETGKIEPELPESMVNKAYSMRINYYLKQFQAKTIGEFSKIISSFGMDYIDFEKKQKLEIMAALKMSIFLSEIAKLEKIEIDKKEQDEKIKQYAKLLKISIDEVKKEKMIMKKVNEEVLRNGAFKFLEEAYLKDCEK